MIDKKHTFFIDRINHPIISESLEGNFITALLGPRRVGKSTFMQWYMQQFPDRQWVFFNMDILSQRQRIANGQLNHEIETSVLHKIGDTSKSKIWLIIDEAQKCPELFEQIKVLYDQFKHDNCIKFIITGSASLDLHNLSAESLAGRIELINLRECTLRETVKFKHTIELENTSLFDTLLKSPEKLEAYIHQIMPYQHVLQEALDFQLVYGGLPEIIALQTEREKFRYLDQYIQSYLEKDVRKIAEITNLDLYQKLIEVLAERTGSLRDDTRLLESLGCARNTLKKYRQYLTATNVYQEVYPIMNDALKRIIKSPKGYIKNNGILSLLTGIDSLALLKTSGKIGHRLENWFLNELHVWLDRDVKRHRVYFWQNTNGTEVDFIVERKPALIPFEVTHRSRIDSKKLKNLATFLEKTQSKGPGVLIYTGEYVYKPKLNIHCIPAWAIA